MIEPFDLSKTIVQHAVQQKLAEFNIAQRLKRVLYIKEEQLQLLFELEALGKIACSFHMEEELEETIAVICGHIEAFPECWRECQTIAQRRLAKSGEHPLLAVWHLVAQLQKAEYSL